MIRILLSLAALGLLASCAQYREPRANCFSFLAQAALRIADIVERISETEDVQESIALNTYARAELVRLVAARIRLQAAHTRVLSAEELAQGPLTPGPRCWHSWRDWRDLGGGDGPNRTPTSFGKAAAQHALTPASGERTRARKSLT